MNRTEELIVLCRRGDSSGYTGLYNEHSKAVYNTVYRLLQHTAEAEDILQESFVAAFQRIDQFNASGSFRAWVKRIAINKSVDLLRKKHISFVELNPVWTADADEQEVDEVAFSFGMERIAAAIDALPATYRTIFNLYAVENIPHAEIAHMLGLQHNTVRTQYHRARQKLLTTLQNKNFHAT